MKQKNKFELILREAKGQFPALFIFSFFVNVLLLTTPMYMMQIFDRVLSSGSTDTLIWLSVIVIASLIVYGLLDQVRKRLLTRIGSWLEAELAPIVVRRSIRAKIQDSKAEASLENVSDIRNFLGGDAILAFLDAPWMPVFLAVIWLLHPILGAISLIGAILIFLLALINDRLTRARQSEVNKKLRAAQHSASAYVSGAGTVSALGMTDTLIGRWRESLRPVRARAVNVMDTNARVATLSRVLRLAMQVMVLGSGAALVLRAELTPGGMIAASVIMARALSPVERSITAWRNFALFRISRAQLADLFNAVPDDIETLKLPRPEGKLVVEGLHYRAPNGSVPILKRIDFSLVPGTACGIIGPSGSGKTTLCKIMVGALRPDFGTVRLDDADVATWDPADLGQYVGYLSQEIELFPGTVAENIARMRPTKDEEIIEAAKLAGAHKMILNMPNGYETQVGPSGMLLSGGQRQRIAIARAMFGDPALLVLDEPNSNLDGDGEVALMRALTEFKKRGRTIVMVAHQPNLLRVADMVIVLKEGQVANFGPRDQVLQSLMKVPLNSGPKSDGKAALKPAQLKTAPPEG
ncbi:type I secretion system permease/ATPase [Ruegeria aquimaris]|uniref:Type I secretion system permease/ATPase n=1 Tax=Ruegeria aquimaris TaxID=2984333 RepID=A0ABT3ARR1_9RHOB|nr:type I secretion system permease/ATPase [Ruegeria sp. XHP0148]MCV2891374.1 type I secretion system permease/ATPase [Ruegeria sp. XHP0148]